MYWCEWRRLSSFPIFVSGPVVFGFAVQPNLHPWSEGAPRVAQQRILVRSSRSRDRQTSANQNGKRPGPNHHQPITFFRAVNLGQMRNYGRIRHFGTFPHLSSFRKFAEIGAVFMLGYCYVLGFIDWFIGMWLTHLKIKFTHKKNSHVIFTSKKEAQAFFSQTFFKPKKKPKKKAEKSLHEKNASRQNLRLRSPSLAKVFFLVWATFFCCILARRAHAFYRCCCSHVVAVFILFFKMLFVLAVCSIYAKEGDQETEAQ